MKFTNVENKNKEALVLFCGFLYSQLHTICRDFFSVSVRIETLLFRASPIDVFNLNNIILIISLKHEKD